MFLSIQEVLATARELGLEAQVRFHPSILKRRAVETSIIDLSLIEIAPLAALSSLHG